MRQALTNFFGVGERDNLPARVRETIQRQQEDSEKLVGIIQFAIIIFFAALYTIAPKPPSMNLMFQPIPWFLGSYFLFTLVRLWLAFRRHMPG